MLKVLDLFSGIGGFSLGLESTGYFKTIAFCEKDKFCQKVLQKNFKDIPIEGEIRNVKGEKYKADVVTGGFPCQPFSTAGKRKGTEDDRYLFPEMLRIIKETQARWVVGENVQGIVNMSEGKVLQGIHNDLETIGYEVQTFIISASSQGAWHKRNRVWIVAANTNSRLSIRENQEIQTRGNTINNGSSSNVSNTKSIRSRKCKEFNKKEGVEKSKSTQLDSFCSDVSNSSFKRLERQHKENSTISWQNKRRQFSEQISEREKKSWWQTQSELCGVPDGLSYELDKDRANRIKALGNSVVPQIIRELGLAIIDAERETY